MDGAPGGIAKKIQLRVAVGAIPGLKSESWGTHYCAGFSSLSPGPPANANNTRSNQIYQGPRLADLTIKSIYNS